MGAFNQLNGAIFDAAAIEARISAVDGKSIYNQRDGGILDFDSLARRLTALDGKIAVGQGGIEFDVDSFMRRLAAIEAGLFTPSQINFTSGLWLDPSDISTGFQDSAGTTPQTATGQPTGKRLDKSGLGNHVLQATAPSRPIWTVAGAISSDVEDSVDDFLQTSTFGAGTLTSDMDLFLLVNRTTNVSDVLISKAQTDASLFIGVSTAGSPTVNVGSVGSVWTNFVDGVQIDGVNTATRGHLDTALGFGAWHVVEYHDLDLSVWTQLTIGGYSGFNAGHSVGGLIVCPAQSPATRSGLRKWLGAKAGLSL